MTSPLPKVYKSAQQISVHAETICQKIQTHAEQLNNPSTDIYGKKSKPDPEQVKSDIATDRLVHFATLGATYFAKKSDECEPGTKQTALRVAAGITGLISVCGGAIVGVLCGAVAWCISQKTLETSKEAGKTVTKEIHKSHAKDHLKEVNETVNPQMFRRNQTGTYRLPDPGIYDVDRTVDLTNNPKRKLAGEIAGRKDDIMAIKKELEQFKQKIDTEQPVLKNTESYKELCRYIDRLSIYEISQ